MSRKGEHRRAGHGGDSARPDAAALARAVGERLLARNAMCATAESCTGGLVAGALTDIAGSSAWFERGFVTYSNEAKQELLGVPPATIERHGAVSEETARAMAEGALVRTPDVVAVAVAITGIAGPGGGSATKPVGTVCFGWAVRGGTTRVVTQRFDGDRDAVRRASVAVALSGLADAAAGLPLPER